MSDWSPAVRTYRLIAEGGNMCMDDPKQPGRYRLPQPGERVRLLTPLHPFREQFGPGTEGTVTGIDHDSGLIHVRWDNGRDLGLIPDIDRWESVT